MQLMDKAKATRFLGQEFLVWLWYRSETGEGAFDLGESVTAHVWFERKMILESEGDGGTEKVTCAGENQQFKEARFALAQNKTIQEAMIRLAMGDNEWSFVLDATWLNYRSLKTPKVMQDRREDPDGLFFEKVSLLYRALSAMDAIYAQFVRLRLSPEWEATELPAILGWIREGR
jgi:hypothetical protein